MNPSHRVERKLYSIIGKCCQHYNAWHIGVLASFWSWQDMRQPTIVWHLDDWDHRERWTGLEWLDRTGLGRHHDSMKLRQRSISSLFFQKSSAAQELNNRTPGTILPGCCSFFRTYCDFLSSSCFRHPERSRSWSWRRPSCLLVSDAARFHYCHAVKHVSRSPDILSSVFYSMNNNNNIIIINYPVLTSKHKVRSTLFHTYKSQTRNA
jgi:hypothetical protein